jgi:hypothetical protein
MGQRAGPGIEPAARADSDDEILGEPLLRLSLYTHLTLPTTERV